MYFYHTGWVFFWLAESGAKLNFFVQFSCMLFFQYFLDTPIHPKKIHYTFFSLKI